jgi:ApbE superfamily uncharacterized protein (UPF0280 family)
MADAGRRAGVGPMAAVAGAIAERVGRGLIGHGGDVIVENGGDVFVRTSRERTVGVHAGRSALSGGLVLRVGPDEAPFGVASSSATVGPSLSFGKADAAIVVAASATMADAAATALCNRVRTRGDLEAAVGWAARLPEVRGAVVILGEQLAAQGQIVFAEPADR